MEKTSASLAWPPEYIIKRYKQSRSVKLRVQPPHGLIISMPMRFSTKHIPSILEENREWITRQLSNLPVCHTAQLPKDIYFRFINEKWRVEYFQINTQSVRLINRPSSEIAIYGNIENKELVKRILKKWLRKKAETDLKLSLQKISDECNLPFNKFNIKSMKTMWGNCSQDKVISLTDKLLFLPMHLVRYVMVHELCHTVHMNHSKQFWSLVEKHDPDYKKHIKEIKVTERYIPDWVY